MPEWVYITTIAILGIGWAVTVACCRTTDQKSERTTAPQASAQRIAKLDLEVLRLEGQVERQRELLLGEAERAEALDLVIHELVELSPAIREAFPPRLAPVSLTSWTGAGRPQLLTRALDADKVLKYREARLRTESLTKDFDEVDAIREKFGASDD